MFFGSLVLAQGGAAGSGQQQLEALEATSSNMVTGISRGFYQEIVTRQLGHFALPEKMKFWITE